MGIIKFVVKSLIEEGLFEIILVSDAKWYCSVFYWSILINYNNILFNNELSLIILILIMVKFNLNFFILKNNRNGQNWIPIFIIFHPFWVWAKLLIIMCFQTIFEKCVDCFLFLLVIINCPEINVIFILNPRFWTYYIIKIILFFQIC